MRHEGTPDSGALFSGCGVYRYELWRRWDPRRATALFIMLNPSTADASADDPTIRRCIGFAKNWRYGAIHVVNLFAYRCTKPWGLVEALDPVGPDNDARITERLRATSLRDRVVCAWGASTARGVGVLVKPRVAAVLALLREAKRVPVCLGTSKTGAPRHPLMLSYAVDPVLWRAA